MTFEIEKDIPIPLFGAKRIYPFAEMEVGDSFVVAVNFLRDKGPIRAAAYEYAKYTGRKFKTRSQPDGSIRIWRTE